MERFGFSEKQDVPVKSMTLDMATRQSAEWFLWIFGESSFDLFIGIGIRTVQWGRVLCLRLGLRACLGLAFRLIGIKNGFHGEPEKEAHHQ